MKPISEIQKTIVELQELLDAIKELDGKAPIILYKLANEKAQTIAHDIAGISTTEALPKVAIVEEEIIVKEEEIEIEEEEIIEEEVVVEEVVIVEKPTPIVEIPTPAATPRKELRKLLTLNDRFLFRRELFGNNDAEMLATLDAIQQCDTYTQALAWIEQHYNWESGNEVVTEFLALVEKNYNN